MIKTSFVLAGLLATSAVQAQSLQEQRSADEVISRLEVYDLKSDTHRVIHEFPYRIEAPNWSPDGKWIVYNSHGRLYRLSAHNPQEEPVMIDTQSAKGCNNDHVISPDGRWIGISDQWPERPYHRGTVWRSRHYQCQFLVARFRKVCLCELRVEVVGILQGLGSIAVRALQ